jgi:serine/threonine-protein kinase
MDRLGKYEIVEKIGVGGFGVVYKAHDPFIKRHVAIKTCSSGDKETRERFLREAEICGNLQHRNIVTVFEFGFEADTPYLVQEYLSGEDLDKKIKRRDFLPMPERVLWLVQIARGLEFAHARGIVHRDIKPANIRILDDGTAKILDFGIAKLAQQQSTLTQAGITLGTAAYLAPEQIRAAPVDARTDVYSFGVLAYELLAFERPFVAREIPALFYKILNETPTPVERLAPETPPELAAIVRRCLAKDSAGRFAPTGELVSALEQIMRRRPVDSTTEATRAHHAAAPEERTAAVQATAKTPLRPISHDEPTRATSIDEVELSYPQGTPRPQSRAMATMAFGGPGRGKRWLAVAAAAVAAVALVLVAMQMARPSTAPGAVSTGNPVPLSAARVTPAPDSPAAVPPSPVERSTPESPRPAPTPTPTPAPTREPEAPRLGRVVIAGGWDAATTVSVAGRRVRLDREQSLELPPGSYDLVFTLETPRYALEQGARVQVVAGATQRIEVPLRRPGQVTIQPYLNSRPGVVRLDGQMAGAAPLRGRWLAPGEHLVEVFPAGAAGGEPAVKVTVTIDSDQESVVTFDVDGTQPTQVRARPAAGG